MSKKKTFYFIDLFCGAGGLSKGFVNAGFKNVFSVEYNKVFAQTYKMNFPSHKVICKDISTISDNQILKFTKNRNVDIIVGGAPCQGFSKAGNIGRKSLIDSRNKLFLQFVRFVRIIKPKMFLFENVAGLVTHNKGKTIKLIINAFKKENYNVVYKILDASNFGVPQIRKRVLIVGTNKKYFNLNEFKFPKGNKTKKISIKNAIDDLPALLSGQKSDIPNHSAMSHSKQMLKKMSYVKDGGTRKDIPCYIRPKTGDSRKYIRYNSSKPSICVTGDMRKVFHYSQNRALTCRELARLQTFDDSFIFFGNQGEIQQQIGNAVPVKFAESVALKILKCLN